MSDTPFGRYPGGPPRRAAGRPAPRPWERSFRCPSTARRRPREASPRRYEEFVALHRAAAEAPPLRPLWCSGLFAAFAGGGLAFAVTAGLRSLLGVDVPVFASAHTAAVPAATSYALCVVAATIQATALMHLLLATAARPVRAFACIGAVGVLLLTVLPLMLRGPLDAALATAGINLAGGAAVVTLLSAVVAAARRNPWDGPFRRGRR